MCFFNANYFLAIPYIFNQVGKVRHQHLLYRQLICEQLDLSSTKSIRAFAKRILDTQPELHLLINNAAVNNGQLTYGADGIEEHMRVNHLGPFLLTQLLRPLLERTHAVIFGQAQVINVSSDMHMTAELDPTDLNRHVVGSGYSASKLANVIHARELSCVDSDRSALLLAVSVHPGLVRTSIFRARPITRVS